MEVRQPILLDADAFLCMRGLGILGDVVQATALVVHLTEYVARHELSPVASLVLDLEGSGRVIIGSVVARTPAFEMWRRLRREGADKGEAEAIAWGASREGVPRPWFVTLDGEARRHSARCGLRAMDVRDFLVRTVALGAVAVEVVRQAVAVWDDRGQQQGRPADWSSFERGFLDLVREAETTARG